MTRISLSFEQQEIIDHIKAEQRGDEPPEETRTPYSIKEKNGLFIVEDSRDPSRVTSAPKRTLEEGARQCWTGHLKRMNRRGCSRNMKRIY